MFPVPFSKTVLHTRLPLDEILTRLAERTGDDPERATEAGQPFLGKIRIDGFAINPTYIGRNSFAAFFRGRFEAGEEGIKLHVTIFSPVLLAELVVLIALFVYLAVTQTSFGLAWAWSAFYTISYVIGYGAPATEAMRELRRLLRSGT